MNLVDGQCRRRTNEATKPPFCRFGRNDWHSSERRRENHGKKAPATYVLISCIQLPHYSPKKDRHRSSNELSRANGKHTKKETMKERDWKKREKDRERPNSKISTRPMWEHSTKSREKNWNIIITVLLFIIFAKDERKRRCVCYKEPHTNKVWK